jgi:hypothetical protein
MPTLIAACRACSQATRVAGLRRWAISISFDERTDMDS